MKHVVGNIYKSIESLIMDHDKLPMSYGFQGGIICVFISRVISLNNILTFP